MPTIVALEKAATEKLQADGLEQTKIVSEICLFFHLAKDFIATDEALNSAVKLFIIEAAKLIVTKERLAYIEHMPSAVNTLSLILLCCKTYEVDATFIPTLERAVRSPAYFSFERVPFRYQEAIWLKEKITCDTAMPRRNCCSSLLFRATHPCVLSRDDLYAKTHSVMFETDFGATRIPPNFISPDIIKGLRHDLYYCFCNADWDLVGEICMAHRYLQISDVSSERYEETLVSVYEKFGFIPAITYNTEFVAGLDNSGKNLYRFAHTYHSTLVFGIILLCRQVKRAGLLINVPAPKQAIEICILDVVDSLARFFAGNKLEYGPLNPNWYAGDPTIDAECLIDGYATICYKTFGRRAALQFLDSVPNWGSYPLVSDTYEYILHV
jgi:hypothetical protein